MAAFGSFLEKGHAYKPIIWSRENQFEEVTEPWLIRFYLFCEIIFIIQFCLNFLLTYVPEDSLSQIPTRDLSKIANKYIHGDMMIDILAIIPFNIFIFFKNSRLLILIKCVRIRSILVIFDVSKFRANLKTITSRYHQRAQDTEEEGNEGLEDKIRLMEILYIQSSFKVMRLLFHIFTTCYVVGVVFYIFADLILEGEFKKVEDKPEELPDTFIVTNELYDNTPN